MKTIKISQIIAVVLILATLGMYSTLFAGETDTRAVEESRYETFSFFAATTTSATSTNNPVDAIGMDVKGADAVTLYFVRTGDATNNGSSTFNVEVSPDEGVTWYTYNKLISNVTNTNSQEKTRVGSVSLVATSTAMVSLDIENDAFSRVRCIVVETTDGTHTCTASVKF